MIEGGLGYILPVVPILIGALFLANISRVWRYAMGARPSIGLPILFALPLLCFIAFVLTRWVGDEF